MACQKVCKQGRDNGQHISKAPSLHLFHSTSWTVHVHGCSLVLRPLPPPTWPGNEASMVSLAGICCSAICIPPGESLGWDLGTRLGPRLWQVLRLLLLEIGYRTGLHTNWAALLQFQPGFIYSKLLQVHLWIVFVWQVRPLKIYL